MTLNPESLDVIEALLLPCTSVFNASKKSAFVEVVGSKPKSTNA